MARQDPTKDSCPEVLARGLTLLLLAFLAAMKTVRVVRKRGKR